MERRSTPAEPRTGLVLLSSLAVVACSGAAVQGARPWLGADRGQLQAQLQIQYQLQQCSDVLGQALPAVPGRLSLYRSGHSLQLVSESEGLTPWVMDNRLHGDPDATFQAIVNDHLIEIQLPSPGRSGHWLLASHWQQWEQPQGFGARPIRVVERCQVAAIENPLQPAPKPAFGLAKAARSRYGMNPVHEPIQQRPDRGQ
jgi:hypothetical protein